LAGAALRRAGLLRLLVRPRTPHAPGRHRRGRPGGHGHGAAAPLQGERPHRGPQRAAVAVRSEAGELRRGGWLPPGGRQCLHPAFRAEAPHPGAGRAGRRTEHREEPPEMSRRPPGRRGRSAAKAWGGRFEAPTARIVEDFTTSLPVDRALYPHDIAGSRAHVRALVRAKILSPAEGRRLAPGLRRVLRELDAGRFRFRPLDEDIHMAVERRLTELLGPLGGKLHTGRSRNDQVALDLRLWLRAECATIDRDLARLQGALVTVARRHLGAVVPGYTHLQRAQPILLAHLFLAYHEMLSRDRAPFRDCP